MAEASPDTLADTVTISLAEPIRRGEQVIAAIDLTKPKGRALRGLALQDLMRTDIVALLTLIPRISNPPLTAPRSTIWGPTIWPRSAEWYAVFSCHLRSAR
jgi:hypothetical protein